MEQAELIVQGRKVGQKSANKRLRANGYVPINVYGRETQNSYGAVEEKLFHKVFRGNFAANFILKLKSEDSSLDGKEVILRDMERDPLTWQMIHADLYEIAKDRAIDVDVPVNLKGTPEGVKVDDGALQVIRRSVLLRALPTELPDSVEVDISALRVGDNIHVRDLPIPQNVRVMDSGEYTVCSVVEGQKEAEPAPEAQPSAEGEAKAEDSKAKDKKAG